MYEQSIRLKLNVANIFSPCWTVFLDDVSSKQAVIFSLPVFAGPPEKILNT
jgi:hypothetical protein